MARPKADKSAQPNIILRGQREHRIDLFKLQVASMKKNISFDSKQPTLVDVEHCHFFRNHDEQGRPRKHSTPVGNHFHEILWRIDEKGNLVAECGPALQHYYVKLPGGAQKKKIRPVSWEKVVETETGTEKIKIPDNHTHDTVYIDSDFVSMEIKKSIQDANSRAIGDMKPEVSKSTAATGQLPEGITLQGSKVD